MVALRLYARSWSLGHQRNTSLALYEIVRTQHVPASARSIVEPLCTAGNAYACAAAAVIDLHRARTAERRTEAMARRPL